MMCIYQVWNVVLQLSNQVITGDYGAMQRYQPDRLIENPSEINLIDQIMN